MDNRRKPLSNMSLPPQTAPRSLQGAPSRFLYTPFLWAVFILGFATVLSFVGDQWLNIKAGKLALELKAPLSELKVGALLPYEVVSKQVMDAEVVEALGTDRYLNWSLRNPSADEDDPLRRAELFITYYSGGHNLVPHTPDVCYRGAGYNPAQVHENFSVQLSSQPQSMPIRVCTFEKTAVFGRQKMTVVYTFHCNGHYVATRTGVRGLINSFSNYYAYFSKVELSFPYASRAESIEGTKMFFDRLLPILARDHWPDFERAEKEARQGHSNTAGL